MEKSGFAMLVLAFAAVVLISGCVQQPAAPTEVSPEEKPTPSPTETLGEILDRGAGISSVKYDMITTAQGMQGTPPMTQTTKVWLKKNKMRTETTMEGQTVINLIDLDAKTMYSYMPAQNVAMRRDFAMAPKPPTENIEKYNPVVIGTETIDGKTTIVVEYTAEGVKTKSWIWKEKGFPIRTETTTAEGKVTIENRNIEFVDIPDSMFELPAGVQIMQIPS